MPVAELPAEARGSFIVRTYSHLALAIVLFVGIEVALFQSGIADSLVGAFSSVNWLLVLGGFMLLSWLATFLAQPSVSRPLQYLGLVLYVGLQAVITVPLLDVANQTAPGTIASAAQATLGGFFLLTGVVVVTRNSPNTSSSLSRMRAAAASNRRTIWLVASNSNSPCSVRMSPRAWR